jgi:cytochrome c5
MLKMVASLIGGGLALSSGIATAADGKAVYSQTCAACHANGVANAPKLADKAAWEPRVKAGKDLLIVSVLKGKGAMPPKGGNASLSEEDVRAAVDYIVAQTR